MKQIKICRGIPCSGKSTLAHKLCDDLYEYDNAAHFEADEWHMNDGGKYNWSPDEVYASHKWCQLCVEQFIRYHESATAVVSNTFITVKEFRAYIDIAKKYNANIEIIEPDTAWKYDVNECFERSKTTHKVPLATIQRMRDRWIDIPCKTYTPVELETYFESLQLSKEQKEFFGEE